MRPTPPQWAERCLSTYVDPGLGWEAAVELWCQYHVSTEIYDRWLVRHSGGYYTENNTAIPHDMSSSIKYAKGQRDLLLAGAPQEGTGGDLVEEARKYVNGMTFKDMWRHVRPCAPYPER